MKPRKIASWQRKNVDTIALKQGIAPRTLQRFLESIRWDDDEVLRRCRRIVANEQSVLDAIGMVDEIGMAKAGRETEGVERKYNDNRGKVKNAVVSVALSFATATIQCLIAARM